jgi:uncharacterized repeat protein (TIGR03803 family)
MKFEMQWDAQCVASLCFIGAKGESMSSQFSRLLKAVLLANCTIWTFASGSAHAARLRLLHSFAGPPDDGSVPYADISFDKAGVAYGTTQYGGANDNCGTVFKLTPKKNMTVLHSFDCYNGGFPQAGVTIDESSGDLYGTATFSPPTFGVVYKISADGSYSILHSFDGVHDGSYPDSDLIFDPAKNLYGTTDQGGAGGYGTLYRLSPDGAFTVLHAFSGGADGAFPMGRLLRDREGNLYGVANSAIDGYGSIYKISPGGALTTLYAFKGAPDGVGPIGGMTRDKAGNLYGATYVGGTAGYGTVFKLSTTGVETVLHSFLGGADGAYPRGDLVGRGTGAVYGVTSYGGDYNCGIAFKITQAGTKKRLHNFRDQFSNGCSPYAGLALDGSDYLVGTTIGGGQGAGTVFRLGKKSQ